MKQEARVIRSRRTYVRNPPDSAAVEGVAGAPGLADAAERLLELVLAQLELERPDDRDGDHGGTREHLLRVHER
jgi:hypothetical protein